MIFWLVLIHKNMEMWIYHSYSCTISLPAIKMERLPSVSGIVGKTFCS